MTRNQSTILGLFRSKWDTARIAARLHKSEADVLKELTIARSIERDCEPVTFDRSPYHHSRIAAWRDTGLRIKAGITH